MKLLIVDDHPVLRQGIATLVQRAWSDIVLVQASSAAETDAALAAHRDFDMVILDLILPDRDGAVLIADIGRQTPDLPVLVLASSEAPADIRAALAAGACGYVPKSAAATTLLAAMRLVLDGEIYLPRQLLDEPPAAAGMVTPRQMEVLRLLADGGSNKEIASRLGLSEKTVKAHLAALFKALGVVSRTRAVAVARQAGLL